MISVEEAKRMVIAHAPLLPFGPQLIEECEGAVLAQDVLSPHAHPLFDMSAVDGYAICGDGPDWRVAGAVAAGQVFDRPLRPGECVRIFTGAQIPAGTRSVLMQERCTVSDGVVRIGSGAITEGANIRRHGEQFQVGELLIAQGRRLDPAAIGLLASAGIEEVDISFKPYVAIVRTGEEFIEKGGDPAGRIFSSNDRMLHSALHGEDCEVDEQIAFIAEDDDEKIAAAFRQALQADVIISTGGVSVGDHDRIATVLRRMNAEIHFHGVAQKPGKPMLFARLEDKPVFALPGNPRAVMVLFWEYVLPFIRAMQGATDPWLRSDRLPLAHPVAVKGDRAEFRAASVKGGTVTLLPDEGSHMLRSLVDAEALAYLPADRRAWQAGDALWVQYLPR